MWKREHWLFAFGMHPIVVSLMGFTYSALVLYRRISRRLERRAPGLFGAGSSSVERDLGLSVVGRSASTLGLSRGLLEHY